MGNCGVIGTVTYVMSVDTNNIDQGAGNDLSIVQQSSGIHLLEVNTEGMSCEGQSWLWVEVACVILAICLGLTVSHLAHYCWCTKRVVKTKVQKVLSNHLRAKTNSDVSPEVMEIPALV